MDVSGGVLCVEWAIIIMIAVIIYHLQFLQPGGESLDVSGGVVCVEWAIIIMIAVIIYHLQCRISAAGGESLLPFNNNNSCHHIPLTV